MHICDVWFSSYNQKGQRSHFLLFLPLSSSSGVKFWKMIRFSWEASQIVRLAIHIEKQNSFHYLGCHHMRNDTCWGVIYVASIDSHGVQWTCTLFTTLPCQGEVSAKGVIFKSNWICDDHWMSYDEFKDKYGINCNFLKYLGVIDTVSKSYRDQLTECKHWSNKAQVLIDLECAVKASSFAYQLLSQNNVVPTSQHRWKRLLICMLTGMLFIQCLTH